MFIFIINICINKLFNKHSNMQNFVIMYISKNKKGIKGYQFVKFGLSSKLKKIEL